MRKSVQHAGRVAGLGVVDIAPVAYDTGAMMHSAIIAGSGPDTDSDTDSDPDTD